MKTAAVLLNQDHNNNTQTVVDATQQPADRNKPCCAYFLAHDQHYLKHRGASSKNKTFAKF